MYLEKEAVDFFRNDDVLRSFLFQHHSDRYGEIRSRKPGRNYEFEQYRPYAPGDDLRDMDWKVYARSDRLFVKNYGTDINARVRIFIDASKSMNYPSGKDSKLHTAKKTAAVLSHLLLRKGNEVALSAIQTSVKDLGPVQRNTLEEQLESVQPSGVMDPFLVMKRSDEREVPILISDCWWGEKKLEEALDHLVRNRVNLVQIVTADESELSVRGDLDFHDLENSSRLHIIPSEIRGAYRRKFRERTEMIRGKFLSNGLLYGLYDMGVKYYVFLKHILEEDSRRRGNRTAARTGA